MLVHRQWHGACELSRALGNPVLPREAGLTGSVGTERIFFCTTRPASLFSLFVRAFTCAHATGFDLRVVLSSSVFVSRLQNNLNRSGIVACLLQTLFDLDPIVLTLKVEPSLIAEETGCGCTIAFAAECVRAYRQEFCRFPVLLPCV